jgi:Na+/H+-translocating membrane pyrophosphatase
MIGVLAQFPKIMGPERWTPNLVKCIRTSTQASLRETLVPRDLVTLSPLVDGMCFRKTAVRGPCSALRSPASRWPSP